MIERESFSREWIAKQRKRYGKTDALLIERQIHAFELLCLLAKSAKPFVFKGGTALILLLPVARRLSIDVDIVGDFKLDELAALVKESSFLNVEEHEREKRGIPKGHFKFYYTSVVDSKETYVLLDVLYSSHGYPKVIAVPVKNDLFVMEAPATVMTPTINGITGDKLTAFAPHTLGVPYGKGKSMEIIKQLFDIGELFNHLTDTAELAAAHKGIVEQENSYRNKKFTLAQVLDDTIEAAFLLSQVKYKGSVTNDEVEEMLKGINQLRGYFLGAKFSIDEARVAAAKVALLGTILKGDGNKNFEQLRYSIESNNQIKDARLEGRFQILNKLKANFPEAFYYWWLVQKLESKHGSSVNS